MRRGSDIPEAKVGERDAFRRVLAASLVLHAVVLLTLGLVPLSWEASPPQVESVPVEIWTPEQLDASMPRPEETPLASPEPAAGPEPPAALPGLRSEAPALPKAEPPGPATIRAKTILSGKVLAHPRSRDMRAALAAMDEETRMEQLCDIEASAQIEAEAKPYRPDRVVAYAMGDTKRVGDALGAPGAAFRSGLQWYRLAFTCTFKSNRRTIQAFEFAIGDPIPKALWEAHNLPAVH